MSIHTLTRRRTTLILTALYYVVPWSHLGVATEVVGVPFMLCYTLLLPGLVLARWGWAQIRDGMDAVAFASALGLFFLTLYCFLWALSGWSVDVARYCLPVPIVLLSLFTPPPDTSRVGPDHRPFSRGERQMARVVLAVIALVAVATWAIGPVLEFTRDATDHIGYIEEIARTKNPFPTTAFYNDPGPNGADIRKNLLHALFGLYKVHLGIDTVRLFAFLGATFTALLGFFVYSSAFTLFASRSTALLSVILFYLSYQGGIDSDFYGSTYYPNRFGIGVFLMFVAAAVRSMERDDRRPFVLVSVFAFTATAIHIQYALLCALVVGVLLLWKTCSPSRTWVMHVRHAIKLGIFAGIAVAPVVVFRFVTAYQRSELHDQVQGAMYITDRWFVSDPVHVWHWVGPVGLGALVAMVPLWMVRRRVAGVGYTIAAMVTVLVSQTVPFLFTPLYDTLSYLVFRFDRIVPWYMLAAYLLVRRDVWLTGVGGRRGWAVFAAAAIVVAIAMSLTPLFNGTSAFSPSTLAAARSASHLPWAGDMEKLAGQIPGRGVIASDPLTSYAWSGFTRHFVVCTFDQHAPPGDQDFSKRMTAARVVLSPLSSSEKRAQAMASAGATHIVTNQALPEGMVLGYWGFPPTIAKTSSRLIDSDPELFEKVAESGPLTLFRWTEMVQGNKQDPANEHIVARVPEGAKIVDEISGEARLQAAVVSPEVVACGGETSVKLYWTRSGDPQPANYVVSIRFDKMDLELPLDGFPFPKINRKMVEYFQGKRFRFRSDHMIASGFFGPDVWPQGSIIYDGTTVPIPADIAPGRYRVEARLLTRAHVPNHRLRDFFYDDDIYSGVSVGEVTITAAESQ